MFTHQEFFHNHNEIRYNEAGEKCSHIRGYSHQQPLSWEWGSMEIVCLTGDINIKALLTVAEGNMVFVNTGDINIKALLTVAEGNMVFVKPDGVAEAWGPARRPFANIVLPCAIVYYVLSVTVEMIYHIKWTSNHEQKSSVAISPPWTKHTFCFVFST